ncbi:ABC transporter ATP-binding protein [Nocardiopsis composta]|uniref:ABC transporter ATP-binding protein n=1 Tax=Nocardiopsis composta TaxID=157465 RepID=UPI0031E28524
MVNVSGAPAHLIQPVVTAVVTPATVVAAMFFLEWRVAAAALATAPLLWGAFRLSAHLSQRTDARVHDSAAETSDRVVEFAGAQGVLRSFGATERGHALLDDALLRQRTAERRALLLGVPALLLNSWVAQLTFTLVLVTAVALALGGEIDLALLVAMLVLANRFVEPLSLLSEYGGALRVATANLRRAVELLETPPLPEPGAPREPESSDVSFTGVHFGYPAEGGEAVPVLKGVSFTAPEGGTTALVGPSGSGKTTVTRLIARFFDADAGTVAIGGVDVRDIGTEALMRRLALVFQDVYLFDGTIEENVRLGRPGATGAELREASRRARLDEVVDRLPDGWATRVGERGAQLSGGERQRVSIARALLKDAPIVLLDEATAALDPQIEAVVAEALGSLRAGRTVLVIAHRLETVRDADRILVLQDGRIREQGRHDELLAEGGLYAGFWRRRSQSRGWALRG